MDFHFKSGLIAFALVISCWTSLCLAQTPPPTPAPIAEQPSPDQTAPGRISGAIVDQSGALLAGAHVSLARSSEDQSSSQEAVSGDDGQFSFSSVAPGPFQLAITAAGFAPQASSGTLHPGEFYLVPQIALVVAANVTDVQVNLSRIQVAQEQVKDE